MADPIQVLSSLDTLADHYAVFEPDQVLTHGQLNSVADYLGDQVRLSRVALSGVGLIGGLHVSLSGGNVVVTRGLGVSTDGDLMVLAGDTVYDRFRPYDTTAPVYRHFYRGVASDGSPTDMMLLHELVPVGESDVLARPLSELPRESGGLAEQAVAMLMETIVNDPDLCSGDDCDNLGRDALHRRRLLLIGRKDAQALLDQVPLAPASERAAALPALAMRRPALARDITTTGALAGRYRDSASASLADLQRALPTLAAQLPEVLTPLFGSDPTPRWVAQLRALEARFAATGSGLQVWHHFVKDLIDQWNALREALLGDDGVLLPALPAFPKHLLLGALAAPREQRTALYPSPLDAKAREHAAQARFGAWKLDAMIRAFAPPTDTALRVTPSHADDRPLESRAIPWHYRADAEPPIHAAWNFRLSARRHEGHNLGYRAGSWTTTARSRDPLAFGIGGHDFFRIEGHLGRPVEEVGDELRKLIASRNLPLQVQEVLLHNDRRLIRKRPPIRFTPLHSLHHLVRQDVAWRMDESLSFGDRHLSDIGEAVTQNRIPATTDTGASVMDAARNARDAVASVQKDAAPVLSHATYSAYKADVGGSGARWKASYANSLTTVSQSRVSLGHVSRADYVSPFDGLINSNQPHWIDWLDDLIQADNDRADDKLLFTRFVQDHPGLDHLGGAWRGGTFVLVYDDGGRVVGDFTLPYRAAEDESPEPTLPPLTRPPYRPPVAVGNGIRVIRPLDLKVRDEVLIESVKFRDDLKIQTASVEGLVKGAFVPSNAVTKGKSLGDLVATGDLVLDASARDMARRRDQVEELRDLLTQPTLPADSRKQVEADLTKAQADLAESVGRVTTQVVRGNVDVAGTEGVKLTQQLTSSVALIQDAGAKTQLDTQLKRVEAGTTGGKKVLIDNLRVVGRFG